MRLHTVAQGGGEGEGEWDASRLEELFDACFRASHHTLLVGGAAEPLYRPGSGGEPHRIFYTRDYFRSALHEVAHWCIAGPHRRLLEDYGYWYQPDGRSGSLQREFERVECAPQALELIFCAACGHDFSVSLDNLSGEVSGAAAFEASVLRRARRYLAEGLPNRANQWMQLLAGHFMQCETVSPGVLEKVFRSL